jgi:hypothetical protein
MESTFHLLHDLLFQVEKSESKGPRKPSHKLFVGNIGVGTSATELKALVEKYIPVLEADVIKNYGFVHIDVESSRQRIDEVRAFN